MHSGRWGLSRETISLLCLRHDHFSCGIFFCLIPQPINQYHNALQKAQMRLFFCLSDLYLYFSTGSNVIILCVYYSCTLIALNYKEKVITFTNWQLKKKGFWDWNPYKFKYDDVCTTECCYWYKSKYHAHFLCTFFYN